jgi:Protein of unknown function DUF262
MQDAVSDCCLRAPRHDTRVGSTPVEALDIKRTLFSVSDFLDWQRQGTLNLDPPFQRRSVWKPGAKSYLVDTVVRGLPTPLIFLRERIDPETLRPMREVIDGQQRLRTLIGFIDEGALADFDVGRDRFTVKAVHNSDIADKAFKKLDPATRSRILGYEFSTQVLPSDTEDRDILMIFARLNSTGTPLNPQELRNAEFFGQLKTLMYQLAYEQLERWIGWRVFNEDQIARMAEVEMTSDLALNIMGGLTGKSQPKLNKFYKDYDGQLANAGEIARRFRLVMDAIDETLGNRIAASVFNSEVYFFSLFTYFYDEMFGLGSDLRRRKPSSLPPRLADNLLKVSKNFRSQNVPQDVLDAVQRASADLGRRRTRLRYLKRVCNAKRA